MSTRQLAVSANDHLVGHLREADGIWEFEYAASWVSAPDSFDLSPALARTESLHRDGSTHRPVQWYFDNLLPEEQLRTVLAKEAGIVDEDAFGLLAYFGSESAGSLVLTDLAAPKTVEQGLRPLPLKVLSERIDKLPRVSLTHDAPKRMSLAGAQHKMLVVLKDGELFEPLGATLSTHILKPAHQGADYPASVVNEFFIMKLAQAVGLRVPSVSCMYVPQPVYLVERFDRQKTPEDGVARRHLIDTCQLLNKYRGFKYTAATLESLALVIEACRNKAAARLQLFRWVVFNTLTGNGDCHLKNISFLVDAAGINIAPAYDLLSTAVYDTRAFADDRANWPDTRLAIPIGDALTFRQVTRASLMQAGKALGLGDKTVEREITTLSQRTAAGADKLIESITASRPSEFDKSPDPQQTTQLTCGDLRLLNAIRHIVIADMVEQVR